MIYLHQLTLIDLPPFAMVLFREPYPQTFLGKKLAKICSISQPRLTIKTSLELIVLVYSVSVVCAAVPLYIPTKEVKQLNNNHLTANVDISLGIVIIYIRHYYKNENIRNEFRFLKGWTTWN